MNHIIEVIRRIAESEVRKLHVTELGIVTSIFPHSTDNDKDNYECNIILKDKDVELRKVPVATQHIGLANILHVGDLVLVAFICGDINSPIIIGRLYNDEDRPPTSKGEEIIYKPPYSKNTDLKRLNIVLPDDTVSLNIYDDRISATVGKSLMSANSDGDVAIRSIKNDDTKEGSDIAIDKTSVISHVKGSTSDSKITLDDSGHIYLKATEDGGHCQITLDSNGINIDTDFDIHLHSKRKITVESEGDLSFKAMSVSMESQLAMKFKSGTTMDVQSTAPLSIKSDTTANIESTAVMTVKGALVKIN